MKKMVYIKASMEIKDFDELGLVYTTPIGGSGTNTETDGNSTDIGDITVPGY